MSLRASSAYAHVLEKARWSHAHGRSVSHIDSADIDAARLFSYGYRTQTIGAFHATRAAIDAAESSGDASDRALCLRQARNLLQSAEAKAMDPVPVDVRAVISTFYFYDFWVNEIVQLLEAACAGRTGEKFEAIRQHFVENLEAVTNSNGIYVTNDFDLPPQGSFRVPKLDISIRPIIYGDHHSWNAAHLAANQFGVSVHRHHRGAEIHLGFGEVEGETILGRSSAAVREGYAMPIRPETEHGFHNASGREHVLPFIFGSRELGGWGVFLDVEPSEGETARLLQPLDAPEMNHSVFLDRAIEQIMQSGAGAARVVLIPAERAGNHAVGGLELALNRGDSVPTELTDDTYRIVSVQHGTARVRIGGAEAEVRERDHFGVPAGLGCSITQTGEARLVFLDSRILPVSDGSGGS